MKCLTQIEEWQALATHQTDIANSHMRDWFQADKERAVRFSLSTPELFLDYSRHRIVDKTIELLCQLATAKQLSSKIEGLFSGYSLNTTEKRPALHTALRDKTGNPIIVAGENIAPQIVAAQEKMIDFANQIHSETWRGITGKPIEHIVNIGIGGSYMGPMFSIHALADFAVSSLKFHFISSVDKSHVNEILRQINPETTLFLVSSKSFSTLETITNANTVASWMKEQLGAEAIKHFIAITASPDKAIQFGITPDHILPMWDWIGGRYSIWSAIGFPLLLMMGHQHFQAFLEGAYETDMHFRTAPFSANMPVIMALLDIWYMNFFAAKAHAIIPYAYRLRHLVPYLQQAVMESNGKSVGLSGSLIPYNTSPVLFGDEGSLGQHAFHQLLHQGQHLIPVDFIIVGQSVPADHKLSDTNLHHDLIIASALSQAQALMLGKTFQEAYDALRHADYSDEEATLLARHQVIPGNRPSSILLMRSLTPKSLGALIALYEHKIFVQGAIWDINSFDQWGIELGKQLLSPILQHVQGKETQADAMTSHLIKQLGRGEH